MATKGEGLGPEVCLEFREGAFAEEAGAVLTRFFDGLKEPGAAGKPVVIHFHGGLVPNQAAREGAARLDKVYREAGAEPLFVVWNSGLGDALRTNLERVVGEPVFRRVRQLVARFADATDRQGAAGGVGVGHGAGLEPAPEMEVARELARADVGELPFDAPRPRATSGLTDAEQRAIEVELNADLVLAQALAESFELPGGSLLNDEFLEKPSEATGRGRGFFTMAGAAAAALYVLGRVVERRVRRTDHGFYTTLVEETVRRFYLNKLFAWSWAAMKDAAADAFARDGGGARLVDAVKAMRGEGDDRRVVLVGHSAGSIWIGHWLLHAARAMPGERFEVVLLAPACTFALFKQALDALGGGDRLKVRCFAMDDVRERADRVGGRTYPRSLLYLDRLFAVENE